jgi:hypothetical protein
MMPFTKRKNHLAKPKKDWLGILHAVALLAGLPLNAIREN